MSIFDFLKDILCKHKDNSVEKPVDLSALGEKYASLRKNSIVVNSDSNAGGLSHLGGLPHVPKNFEWPYITAEFDDEEDAKPHPLSFLAQFDCSELAKYDRENLLPHEGILLFFYSVEGDFWGIEPEEKDCSRVFWFENVNELALAAFPEDLAEDFRYPSVAVSLTECDSYPDLENLPDEYDIDEYEEFFDALHDDCEENVTKLLGYSDTIQGAMQLDCELSTDEYYRNLDEKTLDSIIDEVEQTAKDNWRLLFQLSSDIFEELDDFDIAFGDGGTIYFWIRKEDLKARRFDRVWLILQCY